MRRGCNLAGHRGPHQGPCCPSSLHRRIRRSLPDTILDAAQRTYKLTAPATPQSASLTMSWRYDFRQGTSKGLECRHRWLRTAWTSHRTICRHNAEQHRAYAQEMAEVSVAPCLLRKSFHKSSGSSLLLHLAFVSRRLSTILRKRSRTCKRHSLRHSSNG